MLEIVASRRRLLSWAALSALAGFLWPRPTEAASGARGAGFGPAVAGTYFLSVQHEGFPVALALVTLTRDGGFISNDTSDHGAGGLVTRDGPVHGTWKQSGPHRIAVKTLYFAFDANGIPIWIARTTGRFDFDTAFNSGNGTLTVERFRMDQDPLDPTEIPHDQLNATVTARRVTVDV